MLIFDEIETEIFLKYKNALIAIGVDLSNESVVEYIENCNCDLESRFQAIIAYWCWLKIQDREFINPNKLLINAFSEQWKPINWKDEFLENKEFKSPGEKWWDKASQIDIIKNLVIDVKDNFWSGGKVIFGSPNGGTWTMDLERVMDMSWSEIIEHYEKVTGIMIESHPGHLLLHKKNLNQGEFN